MVLRGWVCWRLSLTDAPLGVPTVQYLDAQRDLLCQQRWMEGGPAMQEA